MKYDVIIVGAGPGGIFSAYELVKENKNLKIGVFELGNPLEKRHCPIDGDKIKSCIKCKTCAIMSGMWMKSIPLMGVSIRICILRLEADFENCVCKTN